MNTPKTGSANCTLKEAGVDLTQRLGDRAEFIRQTQSDLSGMLDSAQSMILRIATILYGPDASKAFVDGLSGALEAEPTRAPQDFVGHSFTSAAFSVADIADYCAQNRRDQLRAVLYFLDRIIEAHVSGAPI